ncbi:MAG TPA: hypothetical protein VFO82_08420, partial [Steroidobacteraceae bacterium]|nr:hypothetical protein [Steroidobacteraceae bacterium]
MSTRPILRFLTFISASAIVGLAAAFIVVVVRPEIIARRAPPAPAPAPAPASPVNPPAVSTPVAVQPVVSSSLPRAVNSYAEAVERAAPAVVNIYTARRVLEPVRPSTIEQLFGDMRTRYRPRVERTLGSGVIVDRA